MLATPAALPPLVMAKQMADFHKHLGTISGVLAIAALALAPGKAKAQTTASQPGAGRAEVVGPLTLQPVLDLRFGRFYRPSGNGSLTITPNGTVTGNGSLSQEVTTPQEVNGRGPASFIVRGDASRVFRVSLPSRIDITNGTATMRVTNFTSNVPARGITLNANGRFDLSIGARLQAFANQAPGAYSGRFPVTVTYD
jgi:hypothetical protein